MNVKFAVTTATVGLKDGRSVLVIFGTHWPADDPVVLQNPAIFSDDPKYGLYASERPVEHVEAASATPGEKRRPGRPRVNVD